MLGWQGLTVATAASLDNKETWRAPSSAATIINPIAGSAKDQEDGRTNYKIACMVCHGQLGKGDGPAAASLEIPPGNLSDPILWQQTDGELFWKINNGRNPMPPFKDAYTEDKIWQIISYVRTLANKPPEGSVSVTLANKTDTGGIPRHIPTELKHIEIPVPTYESGRQAPVSREEYNQLLKLVGLLQRQLASIQKDQHTTTLDTSTEIDNLETQVSNIASLAKKNSSGSTKTLIAGYADAGFKDLTNEDSTFGASFNPLFHWKPTNKLLLTGELEFGLEGSETENGPGVCPYELLGK